jgi:tetratricopeptide (TPR) repeat protein
VAVQSEHRSVVVVDIEGFTRGDRTSPIQLGLRQDLRRLLQGALATAGIGRRACRWHDTGDGFLVSIGPEVAKSRLLDQVVAGLASGLDRHNRTLEPARRLRLRVVVHAGEVVDDRQATVGGAVNFACRLLDAPQLRACLAASRGSLVVAVSDWLYQEVVRHGYGRIDPASYRPFRFTSKDLSGRAWVCAPGDPGVVERAGIAAPDDAAAAGTQGGVVANLPPRNLAFTGRTDLLDRLHEQLTGTPGTTTAVAVTAPAAGMTATSNVTQSVAVSAHAAGVPRVLHGLGGVGKTQLALEYAHRHADDYRIRWWVPAEQPAAIPSHLGALARQLGILEHAEQAQTIAALHAELGRRDGWLLVFDNAEDPHDLHPYWPSASTERGGRVLVTSRNPNWQPIAATTPIDVLPRPEAIAFLQWRASIHKDDADALTEALGDLPLALEQAAAYLEQTRTPPVEYLKLLGSRTRELFALGRPATSEQTIATTWSVSLQRVHAEAPAGEKLLRLCAYLAPDDIPRWLLEHHPEALPKPLAAAVRDRLAYQHALGALRRYSLATVTDDAVSVHRLVQAVVRHQLDAQHTRTWAAAALGLVAAAFPEHADHVETWPVASRLLPQALAAADHANAAGADATLTARLLHEAGRYLRERGEHEQARLLHERALAIRQAHLGPDHPATSSSLDALALVLRAQGDLTSARGLIERAVAIRETRLGLDHPATATSLNRLGRVLRELGDLDGARRLHQRALAIREAHFGPDHTATADSVGALGLVLRDLGDLDGARRLHQRALTIRQASFGPDHPDTAHSLNNLALVLADQGDLDTARALHERALTIREARLGADHTWTADSLNNLAAVLRDQGDLNAARTLAERALQVREARLGADHPYTAHTLSSLARILIDQGDLDGARLLYQRALAILQSRPGDDHPDTTRARTELAMAQAALD